MPLPETQIADLAKLALAAEGGPVSAAKALGPLRLSEPSVSSMIQTGTIEEAMVEGQPHYRITQAGIVALAEALAAR